MPPITPVIPSSWQTDRADLNDALVSLIEAFRTNVSMTVVRKMFSELPNTLTGEHPFVYIGDITEDIHHDASTRSTVYHGTIGFVDTLVNPIETNDRVNVFADYMRDLFTANAALVGQGVLEQTAFAEGEITQGTIRRTNAILTFTWSVLEGRN